MDKNKLIKYSALVGILVVAKIVIDKFSDRSPYDHLKFTYPLTHTQKSIVLKEYNDAYEKMSKYTGIDYKYYKTVASNIREGKYKYKPDGYLYVPTGFTDDYEYIYVGKVEGIDFDPDYDDSEDNTGEPLVDTIDQEYVDSVEAAHDVEVEWYNEYEEGIEEDYDSEED